MLSGAHTSRIRSNQQVVDVRFVLWMHVVERPVCLALAGRHFYDFGHIRLSNRVLAHGTHEPDMVDSHFAVGRVI